METLKQLPVKTSLADLDQSISLLEEKLGRLRERLGPIITAKPRCVEPTPQPTGEVCEIAAQIDSGRRKISQACSRIDDLLEDIEI